MNGEQMQEDFQIRSQKVQKLQILFKSMRKMWMCSENALAGKDDLHLPTWRRI